MNPDQERMRRASSTLEAINELLKKRQFEEVLPAITGCPHLPELVHVFDKEGQGILFKLVYLDQEEAALAMARELEAAGAQLHRKDNNKQTLIYYAAREGRARFVSYCIREGLAVNENDYMMQTPLFYSARHNLDTQIARMLIENDCEVNHKDANGQTCLFYAAAGGNLDMCRLLAENKANLLATDKNKERPMNYAKRGGHRHVIEFLSSFNRNDIRKAREVKEVRLQESSQNTVDRRRKKEGARNEYSLVYINQEGQTKVLSYQDLLAFKGSSEDHAKLFSLMSNPEETLEGLPPPDRRFQKLATKILSHFMRHENGQLFSEPVNYQAHGLYDYPSIVKFPMDFGTIKKKLAFNAFDSEIEFQGDMNLVFDNCILYHGTDRDLGKISLQMKTEFNAMFFKEFA